MKTLILLFLVAGSSLATTVALAAADLGSWSWMVQYGESGNYNCSVARCSEASPALETVNCRNLDKINFAVSRFSNGVAPGHIWLSYSRDCSIEDEPMRSYTLEGNFDVIGFEGKGVFKDPMMGSNGRVPVKSMLIEMLPPEGLAARATIDLGGASPLRLELSCDNRPTVPDGRFRNPPVACPACPKAAHDACVKANSQL